MLICLLLYSTFAEGSEGFVFIAMSLAEHDRVFPVSPVRAIEHIVLCSVHFGHWEPVSIAVASGP